MQVYEYVKDAPFILDLCCGTGKSSIPLIALGKRVIGVDVSTAMLKVYADKCLAKGFSDFVLLAADASAPPLRTGVCKAITLIGGLHHIPEPARCLPYLTGLLSPGGVIIVHEPLHLGVSTKLSKVLINLCALIDVPRVRRALSRRLLRQEVEPLVSEEEELIHTPYERSFSSPEELTSLLDGQVKILALRPQALLSFRLPSDTRPTLAALAVGFDNWLAKKGLTRWSDCEAIFVVASKLSDGQRNYESGR